jgi:DNA replicative helicase MCM subunit Mcm2 (Cdc46/Mcm family)
VAAEPQTPAAERDVEEVNDEATYVCDACGEEIVIPVDPSAGSHQDFVEDCPVCCRPNVIHVDVLDEEVRVWAEPEQDYD